MTGWHLDLMQDECKGLGKWFASRLDARHTIRKVFMNDVETVIHLLLEDQRRELYEGAAPNRRDGSGLWYVTYTHAVAYKPITTVAVYKLEADGHIVKKYPGCYALAQKAVQK